MAKKIKKVNKRRVAERRPFAKRAVKKKTVKRRTIKKPVLKKGERNIMGVITHYFPKVSAGVIKLKKTLKIGDTIKIKGHTTDFKQVVTSMQLDHLPLTEAKKGQEIGLLVNSRVRRKDIVYKL